MATAPTLVLQASFEERRTAEKEDLETYERGVVHHEVEKVATVVLSSDSSLPPATVAPCTWFILSFPP
jgi:hypothetical protein